MSKIKILIVDDELIMRESLAGWLERDGHAVQTAASGEEALEKIKETQFNIFLVDIKMEGMSGLDVLRSVRESDPDADVVMITAYGSIPSAIEAMKDGAYDYMLKPFDPNELGVLIEKITQHQEQARENIYLKEQYKERTRFESMIGQSGPMQEIFNLICDVAPMDSTGLITGETGTGKGLAAKAIHTNSSRRDGPFVTVNCGAIPEELLESELFGHVKGAFTNAVHHREGRFALADGGTIFLDEIGDMSPNLQVKLLRVLQERTFEPVGSSKTIKVDVRVIAATNQHLEALIEKKLFREDLYYRLNVLPIEAPPLRERSDDIPLLIHHFIDSGNQKENTRIDGISEEAMKL